VRAVETGDNIHRTCHFSSCFASQPVSGLNLPDSVIKEAETAWSKVVATVNNLHPSGSLESQFYPLFAKRVTEPLMIEGKRVLNCFRSQFFLPIFAILYQVRWITSVFLFVVKNSLQKNNGCFRLLLLNVKFLSFQYLTGNCEIKGGPSKSRSRGGALDRLPKKKPF